MKNFSEIYNPSVNRTFMKNGVKYAQIVYLKDNTRRYAQYRVKSSPQSNYQRILKMIESDKEKAKKTREGNVWSVTVNHLIKIRTERNKKVFYPIVKYTQKFATKYERNIKKYIDQFKHDLRMGTTPIDYFEPEYVESTYEKVMLKRKSLGQIQMFSKIQWEKKGSCVYDFLLSKLKKPKIMNTLTKEGIYKSIFCDDLDTNDEALEALKDPDVFDRGLTIDNIHTFCTNHKIAMYAVDFDDKLFMHHIPPRVGKGKPVLMFKIANNHLYPIEDKCIRKSISEKAKKFASNVFKPKEVKKESVAPELNEFVLVDNEEPDIIEYVGGGKRDVIFTKVEDLMDMWIKIIHDNPDSYEGFDQKGFKYFENKLTSFSYNDTCFIINEHYEAVKKMCKTFKIEFRNQTLAVFTNQLFDMMTEKKGDAEKVDIYSSFNMATSEVIESDLYHKIPMNDIYEIPDDMDDVKAFDINRAYTSAMMINEYDYPKFTIFDSVEPFDGELKTGIYYVESENYRPLNGNGWYSRGLMEYCKVANIEHVIKYQLVANESVPHDYFKPLCDVVVSKCDPYIAKLMINMFIGCLNRTTYTKLTGYITSDINQASEKYFTESNVVISQVSPYEDKPIYHVQRCIESIHTNVRVPIYRQILDNNAIQLHKLEVAVGGELLKIKTDCIFVRNGKEPDNMGVKVGEIKYEEIKKDVHFKYVRSNAPREETYEYTEPDDWKTCDSKLAKDKNVEPLIDWILSTGEGCSVDGMAGSGKSYIIKALSKKMDGENKKYAVAAPTNKAALLIGGTTIHKLFKMKPGDNTIPSQMVYYLNTLEYLIVDEVSMVPAYMYEILFQLKKLCPKLKFILCGDWNQLDPVEHIKRDYKNSICFKQLVDHNKVLLTENRRSDNVMRLLLENLLRDGDINLSDIGTSETLINMCWTNRMRKRVNTSCMERVRMQGGGYVEISKIDKDKDSQDLILTVGAPVICRKNDVKRMCYNNEMYKVVSWTSKDITVENDVGWRVVMSLKFFQSLFLVAYCTTVHKMQGQTINEPFTIHQWDLFDIKLRYTSLSRTTDKKLANILTNRKANVKGTFEELMENKIKSYRESDRKKGLNTNVTVGWVDRQLTKCDGKCTHCGYTVHRCDYVPNSSMQISLDRIDNRKGHVKDNTVISCWGCNHTKQQYDQTKKRSFDIEM